MPIEDAGVAGGGFVCYATWPACVPLENVLLIYLGSQSYREEDRTEAALVGTHR